MSTTFVRARTGHAGQSEVFRPPEALLALVVAPSATIATWIARSHQRRALRELAERSDHDHLLEDIGVTREDALRTAAKWFWQP